MKAINDLLRDLEALRDECTYDDFKDSNGLLADWWVVEKLDAIIAAAHAKGEQAPGLREAAEGLLPILELGVDPGPHDMQTLDGRAAWIDRMKPARERLRAALAAFPAPDETYCAYCGARFPLDNKAASLVTEHIHTCAKHPMRDVEKDRDEWKRKASPAPCPGLRESIIEILSTVISDPAVSEETVTDAILRLWPGPVREEKA